MPSVGGGGGGGGFHGGGFSGGGGGYHGGHHHGGGFYFFGGGLISRIVSIVFMPLIFMGVGIFIFVLGLSGLINPRSTSIDYNETTFVSLAMNKYAEYYGDDENEILFVLLTSSEPEKDGYYQISIVGDNIRSEISAMFGGDTTFYGREFDNAMPKAYTNSGLNAFRSALSKTGEAIEYMDLKSNFYIPFEDKYSPRFENEAEYMNIDQTYLVPQLEEFKEKTGITFSIYVRDMDEVFSREGNGFFSLLIFGAIFFAAGAYIAYLGVKTITKRREDKAAKRSFDDYAREREDNSSKRKKGDENDPYDF